MPPHSYTSSCWKLFLLLDGRAETGWHSDTHVIRCFRNLLSLSFTMGICNFVRLDTGVSVILNIFWRCYGTGDFSKVTFESFEIDGILFIAFRVKLRLTRVQVNLSVTISPFLWQSKNALLG